MHLLLQPKLEHLQPVHLARTATVHLWLQPKLVLLQPEHLARSVTVHLWLQPNLVRWLKYFRLEIPPPGRWCRTSLPSRPLPCGELSYEQIVLTGDLAGRPCSRRHGHTRTHPCKGDGSHAVGSSGSVMRSLSLGRWALVASTLMRTRTLSKAGVRVKVGLGLGLGLGPGSVVSGIGGGLGLG